jgi:hypothetical protein
VQCRLSDGSSAPVSKAASGGINRFNTDFAGTARQMVDLHIAPPDTPSLVVDPPALRWHPAMSGPAQLPGG